MYLIIQHYPLAAANVGGTTNTIEKNITVNENNGISKGIENIYDAVVVVQSYANNQLASTGTGFVYKTDDKYGYILTNQHVVSSASKVNVLFTNDKEVETTILGGDEYLDLAVLRVPKEEVTNCIYWRQLDASRNSIQMVGQANFSHKELQNKSCNDIQDMLMLQKNINWNDFPTYQKRGTCVIKEEYYPEPVKGYENCEVNALDVRTRWVIDKDIPIFKGEGRNYIEKLVMVGE